MNVKKAVYSEVARLVKAMGHPARLEILELLAQREWCVEELADALGMPVGMCSRHLQSLKEARLVHAVRHGLYVHYSLAGDDVAEVHRRLLRLASHRLAEVDRLLKRAAPEQDVPSVSTEDLVSMVAHDEVVLLDVRPRDEFDSAHIHNALSIPIDDLARAYRKLPKGRPVVAYCRGPVCLLAADAVRFLRSKGFEAFRYEESVRDGRNEGLAVHSSHQTSSQ